MLKSIALLALSVPATLGVIADITLEPDQNNVVAGRLEGRWEADEVISERMGMNSSSKSYEFVEDESITAALPAKFAKLFENFRLYEAGTVTVRSGDEVSFSGPYLLTNHAGNPHLLVFRERDGEPLADIESMNIFVGHGKTKAKDVLLVGGDFNNQPFQAFRRVAQK